MGNPEVLEKLKSLQSGYMITPKRYAVLVKQLKSLGYTEDSDIGMEIRKLIIVEGRKHKEVIGGDLKKVIKRNEATVVRVQTPEGISDAVFPGNLERHPISVEDLDSLGQLGVIISRALQLDGIRRRIKLGKRHGS